MRNILALRMLFRLFLIWEASGRVGRFRFLFRVRIFG